MPGGTPPSDRGAPMAPIPPIMPPIPDGRPPIGAMPGFIPATAGSPIPGCPAYSVLRGIGGSGRKGGKDIPIGKCGG